MDETEATQVTAAYDTLYGFILAQEALQRATLWTALDHLWYWVRKAHQAGDATTAGEKATSNTGPKPDSTDTGESGAAYDAEEETKRCPNCHSRLVRIREGKRMCGSCGVELV